jgi:hypothetical protein
MTKSVILALKDELKPMSNQEEIVAREQKQDQILCQIFAELSKQQVNGSPDSTVFYVAVLNP